MIEYFKITIRFTDDTPTIRLRLEYTEDHVSNIARTQCAFETMYNFKSFTVKRIREIETELIKIDKAS